MAENILAFIMAGGVGQRLRPLTDVRAKPAVPFGGIYRIIDFTLSNCLNSDIRTVYVLTQYKSNSLSQHLKSGWNLLSRRLNQFIDEIPAQMQLGQHWYAGTADAIRQNMALVDLTSPSHVLILPGDHIYKMDYRLLKRFHEEKGATMTIACLRVPVEHAQGQYGVLEADEDGRIVSFEEKPIHPKCLDDTDECFASMGIYMFDTQQLKRMLDNDMTDFSQHLIPDFVRRGEAVYAYDFKKHNIIPEREYFTEDGRRNARLVPCSSDADYWRDVGTIEGFWQANLDLVSSHPKFNLYGEKWPIFNDAQHFPPAKFVHDSPGRVGQAHNSIVADGVILSGCHVKRSLLSPGTYIHSYSEVENSVLFGGSMAGGMITETTIGRHCRVRNAIMDKNVSLRAGTEIGFDMEADAARGLTVHALPAGQGHVVVVPHGFQI